MKKPTNGTSLAQASEVAQRGFSIVEILVGVAIGLISIIMMFQLTQNWEARKRTTAAGSDAQSSGSIASYRISQDIKQAGFGFGTAGADLGCIVSAYDDLRATKTFEFQFVPLRITQGTAASPPDRIEVLYGNADTLSISHQYTLPTNFSKRTTSLGPRKGLARGGLAIIAPGGNSCGMVQITDNTDDDEFTVGHAIGDYPHQNGNTATAQFNDPAGYLGTVLNVNPAVGHIYNLGLAPTLNRWQVTGRTLQACEVIRGACAGSTDIADGIIDLQAQYGLDLNNDYLVDTWVDPDADEEALPGAATWNQVRAVRVAILARGQHFEANVVTTTTPATGWLDDDDDPILFNIKDVDGNAPANDNSADDWRHYRYRVYSSTIPLRNMVWGTMP